MATTIRGTVRGMAGRANPAFAVGAVVVPVAVLVGAVLFGTVQHLTYAHVMAGALWTGIDLFMALVLGPVIGGLAVSERASLFERFTPKMTFLMPALALIGWQFDAFGDRRWLAAFGLALVGSGAYLAVALPGFAATNRLIVLALAIVTVLTVVGFGLLLPGEVRIYLEMVSDDPDPNVISDVGMRNARLSGVQGLFQLVIVVVMAYLRWGFT